MTDQIGASVHGSAMEGGDALPSDRRHIIGNGEKSFQPDYSTSTTKDAGDLALEASKKNSDKIHEKEAAEAAK